MPVNQLLFGGSPGTAIVQNFDNYKPPPPPHTHTFIGEEHVGVTVSVCLSVHL